MPIEPGETLNILLVDGLNTPLKDEGFLRSQLLQYARNADPHARVAVLGLANRLVLLQGFTSDPATLRGILEHKLIARAPGGLSTHASPAATGTIEGSPSTMSLAANLREFEAGLGVMETGLHVHYTLDAFNTLAHYLAAFPGRKNLIWFSGSFPFNVVPDAAAAHPFEVADADGDELRETVRLLAKAQVAVYPVDARGLIGQPASDAKVAGSAHADHGHGSNGDLSKATQPQTAERAVMEAIAVNTGGRALYDPVSLADAVKSVIAGGSNYYMLSYVPGGGSPNGGSLSGGDGNGSYRPIQVDVTGVGDAQALQLAYRRGDYVSDGVRPPQGNASKDSPASAPEEGRAMAYRQAAMSRGGPAPEDLLFRVRVLPASTTTETSLAPNNHLGPDAPFNGPFRRYDLDFLSVPGQLMFTQQPDGRIAAKVEFLAYVFDTEGRLLNATGREMTLVPKTDDVSKIARSVIRSHLEVSVPDRAETFLRIGVRDVTGNRFGVVEIPISAVTSLPPASYAPATPPAPAKPGGPTTPPQV